MSTLTVMLALLANIVTDHSRTPPKCIVGAWQIVSYIDDDKNAHHPDSEYLIFFGDHVIFADIAIDLCFGTEPCFSAFRLKAWASKNERHFSLVDIGNVHSPWLQVELPKDSNQAHITTTFNLPSGEKLAVQFDVMRADQKIIRQQLTKIFNSETTDLDDLAKADLEHWLND